MRFLQYGRTNRVTLSIVGGLAAVLLLSLFFADTLEDLVTMQSGIPTVGSFSALFSSILLLASRGVTSTISAIGYPGVFLLMLLESTSLPIPSEVILPFSGYLASLGTLNLWIVIFLSTAAGIAGSLVDYYLGSVAAKWGERKSLRGIRIGETILVKKVEMWFNRYGSLAVFLTRMIPGARTLVSFPAGAARMKMSRFLTFTALGCFLWSAVLTYLGFFLGSRWSEILGTFHYLSVAILIAVGCTLFAWLALWATRFRRKS